MRPLPKIESVKEGEGRKEGGGRKEGRRGREEGEGRGRRKDWEGSEGLPAASEALSMGQLPN